MTKRKPAKRSKRVEAYTIERPCSCNGRVLHYPEGGVFTCPYCNGTGKRNEKAVHPSHKMSRARSEILAPCGTPRFYSVRECKACGLQEARAAAGHFLNGLQYQCKAARAKR